MVYREAPSPIDVARDVWIEAQELETVAAMNKYRAQAELARAQGELETAWAEHGALTALERHLGAMIQASERVRGESPSRAAPKRLASELENAERDAKQAKQKIAQAEARVAEARSELERALDELGGATRARMAAEAKLKELGQMAGS